MQEELDSLAQGDQARSDRVAVLQGELAASAERAAQAEAEAIALRERLREAEAAREEADARAEQAHAQAEAEWAARMKAAENELRKLREAGSYDVTSAVALRGELAKLRDELASTKRQLSSQTTSRRS